VYLKQRFQNTKKTEENIGVRLAFWVQAGFRIPNYIHFTTTTKTKAASRRFLVGLFSVTLLALSSSAVLGQTTTQVSGTFAPRGNYSVNGNLFVRPLTTMQCKVASQQSDNVAVSGVATLDGRLLVTMTGRFTRDGPSRYTLLHARGGLMGVFSLVSIKWLMDQGLSARITYDPNHVYLEIAYEPGRFPPPLDTQRPSEITRTPATVSEGGRSDKPSSSAVTTLRPTVAGLTFAERVAYQRAIEEVRWRHRIWPNDNPQPKPSLDVIVSQAQLEKKVEEYLRKSQGLADYWQRPITVEELQTEIDRMAQHTKQPEVLRELFEALGNDPFVIAECLARPILADRAIAGLGAHNQSVAKIVEASRDTAEDLLTMKIPRASYRLPEISPWAQCTDDTWAASATVNAPDARNGHTAVWTGSEMIIWGGAFTDNVYHFLNTGGRYDPATDTWTPTGMTNAPIGRWRHAAVWTGSEMIVWGGGTNDFLNTGGRYNPTDDSWTAISTANAPTERVKHTALWTGSEMVVWGGYNYNFTQASTLVAGTALLRIVG